MYLSIYLSFYLSIYLSIYLYVYIYLYVCIYLSICMYISIYRICITLFSSGLLTIVLGLSNHLLCKLSKPPQHDSMPERVRLGKETQLLHKLFALDALHDASWSQLLVSYGPIYRGKSTNVCIPPNGFHHCQACNEMAALPGPMFDSSWKSCRPSSWPVQAAQACVSACKYMCMFACAYVC